MNRSRTTQAAVKKEIIPAQTKERVRDRIMRTASALFYCRGIHAVGVDAIASEAGTNKMSFYRNFSSKDELVAQYLREAEAEAWGWWDETVAAHAGDPRAQVEALFGLLFKKTCTEGSRWQTPPWKSPTPITRRAPSSRSTRPTCAGASAGLRARCMRETPTLWETR